MERKIIVYDIDLDKLNEDIENLIIRDHIIINRPSEPFPFFKKKIYQRFLILNILISLMKKMKN